MNSENGSEVLFALMAEVTDGMIAISQTLSSNPKCRSATRGTDIRLYRDTLKNGESKYSFESYVEAEAKNGGLYCWSLDIILTTNIWRMRRTVGKRVRDGEEVVQAFEDFSSDSVFELEQNLPNLLTEFVSCAERFEF
jgi:hypothetical protein